MSETAALPGHHLLLDFHGARSLNAASIERALREAAAVAGARVLEARFHDFGNGGVTGVLLLAESHVSVHTWPEKSFAALDIFLCGTAQVEPARAVLEAAFAPERVTATLIRRGA